MTANRLSSLFLSLLCWCVFCTTAPAYAAVVVSEPTTCGTNGSGGDTNQRTTGYVCSAFTPAANAVLLLFVGASDTLAAAPNAAVTGGGLTWTLVGSTTRTGADTLYVFRAQTGASPASTTIDFSCTGDTASGVTMTLAQITGANTTSPIRQSKFSAAGGVTGTNATITLDAAAVTTSAVLVAHYNTLNIPMSAGPTNYTEISDDTYNTPRHSMAVAYRATGETGSTLTFTSNSTTYAIAAVEVAVMTTGGGAGVQEICGNGYDDDGTGGDASCGTPDSDWDGYVDSEDCAPTDRTIYAGVSVTCGTDGWKTCQASGSYTACTEGTLCEDTNGASSDCYYVNPTTGSDSNNCTSRATACATLAPFSKGGAKELNAGDVLYLMSGTIDSAVNTSCSSQRAALCLNGMNGTSTHPITIKGYPGQTPNVDISACISNATKCAAFYVLNSDFVTIGPNITMADMWGQGVKASDGTNSLRITGNILKNFEGDALPPTGDNVTAIYLQSILTFEVDHNFLFDTYDRLNASDKNSAQLTVFQGSDGRVHHNVMYTTYAEDTGPGCFKYKHADRGTVNGGVLNPAGSGNAEVDYNIFWNCTGSSQGAFGNAQPSMHWHHNLMVNSVPPLLSDLGGANYMNGMLYEYNTYVGSKGMKFDPRFSYDSVIGSFIFRRNIVQDDEPSYPNDQAAMDIGHFVTNLQFTDMTPDLSFSNNCYRANGGATFKWSLGGGGEASGAVYTSLTDWQTALTNASAAAADTGSFMMDQDLSVETFDPLDSDCDNMGRYASYVSETGSTVSGGSSTTTSTSTTTTSTTTAATTTTLQSESSGVGVGRNNSPRHWGKGRQ